MRPKRLSRSPFFRASPVEAPFIAAGPRPLIFRGSDGNSLGSPSYRPRTSADARLETFLSWSAAVLLIVFVFFEVIGFGALASGGAAGAEAQGDKIRQLVLMGLFGWSIVLALVRSQAAMRLVVASWPALLVLGVMTVSLLWSQFPGLTVRRAMVFWIYLGIGIGTSVWITSATRYVGIWALACGIGVIVDLSSAVVLPDIAWTDLGFAGLHYQKNSAGLFAFVALVFLAAGGFASRTMPTRLAAFLVFGLGLVFLMLTRSKNAIGFTVIIALVVLPMLMLARSGRNRWLILVALLGAFTGLMLLVLGLQGWSFWDLLGKVSGDSTFTGRNELWAAALSYIGDNPFLGRGFGAHWSVPPDAHPLLNKYGWWSSNYDDLISYNQSHNGYLDIAVQLGVLGAVVVAVFLVSLANTIWIIFQLGARHGEDPVPIYAVSCLMIGILSLNLFESTLFFPSAPLGAVFFLVSIYLTSWRLNLKQDIGAPREISISEPQRKPNSGPWIRP
ncbi:O-antigen ligase family protein [Amorphus sp. 3PC139-8]|uniref:O-antigen ligase family protein n=1 Tax=Amorphus sp. 3PC139-8 TaxID=2735676 RepID=UPI00345C9158